MYPTIGSFNSFFSKDVIKSRTDSSNVSFEKGAQSQCEVLKLQGKDSLVRFDAIYVRFTYS